MGGPVVIGVSCNWVLFLVIARAIKSSARARSKQTVMSKIKMRSRQLRSALIVSTFMGLGWITGFFLLMNDSNYSEISMVIRWLFIAVNTPQGLFIFLFYVVLNDDNRGFWLAKLRSLWELLQTADTRSRFRKRKVIYLSRAGTKCEHISASASATDPGPASHLHKTEELLQMKPVSSIEKDWSDEVIRTVNYELLAALAAPLRKQFEASNDQS